MVDWEKTSRRVRAKAVLRPKTPEPMMRIEEGGEKGGGEEGSGEGAEPILDNGISELHRGS
jgi:hypothetical protein